MTTVICISVSTIYFNKSLDLSFLGKACIASVRGVPCAGAPREARAPRPRGPSSEASRRAGASTRAYACRARPEKPLETKAESEGERLLSRAPRRFTPGSCAQPAREYHRGRRGDAQRREESEAGRRCDRRPRRASSPREAFGELARWSVTGARSTCTWASSSG